MPDGLDTPVLPSPGLGFSVYSQRVELDVDFATRTVTGRTEITIQPHLKELKTIRLNCRQCIIKRLNVEGRGPSLTYNDPYASLNLHASSTVHQHHMLRRKIEPCLRDFPDEELAINLPKSIHIEEVDPTSTSAQNLLFSKVSKNIKSQGDDISGLIETPVTARTAEDHGARFTPLKISIEYEIKNFRDGLHTTMAAHMLEEREASLSSEEKALDLAVICSGDMTDEIVDPTDPSRKTVSFLCATPVSPQYIGFAIGPFEHVDLSEFREMDEDDKLGQNAIRVHGFCLPGRADEVRNTCMPMAKAIDFFTVTYGSYPFSSYKLCFVDDLAPDIADTASLSICSNRLLFPEDILEPLDAVTRQLVHALAVQWIGVNIIPKEATDTWAVVGIAYFITETFLRKLSGNNEYRYQQKLAADKVYELDIARPSLHQLGGLLTLDTSEMDFLALKAPLVLFILDRRLTKASGSSGVSRIINRVFLNAKVGEMPHGAITTSYFMRTCEKLGHAKLEQFFNQWVFGAGCPSFQVSQRFNKKKLCVEMVIKQVQADRVAEPNLEPATFMREVQEDRNEVFAGVLQPVFTGPMTIRIHEADGTPYEHIVEIKESLTKFEIPYNTKYKRLKRSRRQKERAAAASGMNVTEDSQDDVLLYCLGDVLQSEDEVAEWRLSDWTKEDEDRMNQESYEWIRMDADFEWIGKIALVMPAYMYVSQLQQDRDVVAQLESIQYLTSQKPHPIMSSILIRTLMDRRYFHGIRTSAAMGLAKCAREELAWIGQFHLEKAFQEFFCFPDSPMTRSNDFSDRIAYLIQCAIPRAMAKIRDNTGKAPLSVRRFFVDKLKFNDNTNNEFSDCHYVATLMSCLATSLVTTRDPNVYSFSLSEEDEEDERLFQKSAVDEIERYRRIDEWISSFQNVYSLTALECLKRLIAGRVVPSRKADILRYTRVGNAENLRLRAFACLVELGMFKNNQFLKFLLYSLQTDPSPYVREHLFRIFGQGLGQTAIGNTSEDRQIQHDGSLIIEQEASTEGRQARIARMQTVPGALAALKQELGQNEILKKGLWSAIQSPYLGLREMSSLLDICAVLYEPQTSLIVKLRYPRYYRVEHLGRGKLRFSRINRFRTTPKPELVWPPPAPAGPAVAHAPSHTTKPPKLPPLTRRPSVVHAPAAPQARYSPPPPPPPPPPPAASPSFSPGMAKAPAAPVRKPTILKLKTGKRTSENAFAKSSPQAPALATTPVSTSTGSLRTYPSTGTGATPALYSPPAYSPSTFSPHANPYTTQTQQQQQAAPTLNLGAFRTFAPIEPPAAAPAPVSLHGGGGGAASPTTAEGEGEPEAKKPRLKLKLGLGLKGKSKP
ncbi:hypothetical protein B0A49_01555 [Cryomyces minteri]|uniref:Transcription initiation factor TFIID subunit 2 n=1 Tax=Cryomyces minteri TaxID=331657 RepID=A0A4U0XN33_9PEZI|nr:hypothetical protein B0A49_01555 [Cryomyces minteri]